MKKEHRKIWVAAASFLVIAIGGLFFFLSDSSDNTRLQIQLWGSKSTSASLITIDCSQSKPQPSKKKACDLLLQGQKDWKMIWGAQDCGVKPGRNPSPLARISGTVKGKKVSGTYQMGPCPRSLQAWVIVSQLWAQPVVSKVPVRMLVLLPEKFPDPGNWPERILWLKQAQKNPITPQCTQSLPHLDTRVCLLPERRDGEQQVTVRLTVEQMYALIKANPAKVLQILREAKRTTPPPGYPGSADNPVQ